MRRAREEAGEGGIEEGESGAGESAGVESAVEDVDGEDLVSGGLVFGVEGLRVELGEHSRCWYWVAVDSI